MAKYGIDNVRGGAYCRMDIDCATMKLLKREIWNALNKCMECGSEYHFIAKCEKYTESLKQTNNNNNSIIHYHYITIILLLILYFFLS